jgi:hypothetical protein
MSRRERHARGVRRRDQRLPFRNRFRDRLLDEDRRPALDERQRDVAMHFRRHGDRNGVDVAQQRPEIRQRPRPRRLRHFGRAIRVGINHGDEVRALDAREQPRVMLAQVPDPDDGHAQP